MFLFRGFAESSDVGWFRSFFVHKVDSRKDAHSNLLSKKETSHLYKIQCENLCVYACVFIFTWTNRRDIGLLYCIIACSGYIGYQISIPPSCVVQSLTNPVLKDHFIFLVVHNVKPDCLDAYNSLS